MSLEFFLSRRYLSSRKGGGLSVITWIALLGVIVGVASLVTVLAVMSGFEHDLRSKILGNNAHILVQVPPEEIDSTLKTVRETAGVASAMPVIYGEGFILNSRGGAEGVFLKGVDPELVRKVLDLDEFVEEGNWKDFKGKNVILGATLATQLKLMPGDPFTLVLNRGDFSPLGLVPRMQRLHMSDTFRSGMTQYDSRHAYLALSLAEELLEVKPKSIEVRASDARLIHEVRDRLREALPGASVNDWLSWNKEFLSALQLEKLVMGFILALITLVAAFNICGSLIMVVRDKTKDIAILKSMGAFDRSILRIFLNQGLFIGLVGTSFGILLGVSMSLLLRDFVKFPLDKSVYMIDTLPVDLRLNDVVMVAVGALLITLIATLYPARMAAKIVPTEGLKQSI